MARIWAWAKDLFWLALAVALVAAGVLGFQYLGAIRPEVAATPVERPVVLVETLAAEPFAGPLPLRGDGFLTPFRQVALAAETAGRVVAMHPALETRGRFAAGDVLVELDDATARAALDQTEANIATTTARMDLVETQLARAETLRARGVIPQEQLDQLQSQKAELSASLTALQAARRSAVVALERALVRAPFDGAVLERSAELGSVVQPGQALATLYTADALEITVPLRQTEAALIPGLFQGQAARGVVETDFAGQVYRWQAEVARVDSALDPRTRRLNVTLRLGAPLAGGAELPAGLPPALINAFARVEIEGAVLENLLALPSTAFRAGGEVWLYQDGVLAVRSAERLHVDGETSFLRITDLPEGAEVVTSALTTAFAGMALRRAASDARRARAGE